LFAPAAFVAKVAAYDSIEVKMLTLEPPRNLKADADPWRSLELSRTGLSRFLRLAREAVGLKGEVDVLLAGDRTLKRLNREFRGKDKPTDVLSFPAIEECVDRHSGDLAISLDTARRQAKEQGHSLSTEVRVLLLHGLLHLSGMDHETDSGEMAALETELRLKLRLPNGLIARTAASPKKFQAVANNRAVKEAAYGLKAKRSAKVTA
jgi:probable rRNA maturation factor